MTWDKGQHKCCGSWESAQTTGTDNEAYGRLLSYWAGEWRVGCELPEVRFCPWCGKAIAEPQTTVTAAEGER